MNKNKSHIITIKSNESNDSLILIKEIQPKLKILNKYFKLEELKQQEIITKCRDGYIDIKKPNYLFMRSDIKDKNKYFKPSTNICATKRKRTFSTLFSRHVVLNGFRNNNSGIKIEKDIIIPRSFYDLQSLIEIKKTKNNIKQEKQLLNEEKYYKIKEIIKKNNRKSNNKISKNSERNRTKVMNTKERFTESVILKNNTNYEIIIKNNKIKKPITSIYNKEKKPLTCRKNKEKEKIVSAKCRRIIKSAIPQKSKKSRTEREHITNYNIRNIKNFYANRSNTNISNINISCCTTTFRSNSKSSSKQLKNNDLLRKIEKQVLNPDSFLSMKKNNNNNILEKSEFKTTKEIIERINNDGKIIDKYIRDKEKGTNVCNKNDKEKILLNLADRLKEYKLKHLSKGFKQKQKKFFDDDDDENFYGKKLKKIPGKAQQFFRNVYKQILFENRILNKDLKNKKITEGIEEIEKKKRFYYKIKKEVKKNMIITKDNFITEKDDKIMIDELNKLFDYYGSINGLEWLITKSHIIDFRAKSK